MTPTFMFLQTAESFPWTPVLAIVGAILSATLTWLFTRRGQSATIHKNEMDLALSILARLEPLHVKSLADEVEKARLIADLKKCNDGRESCVAVRDQLLRSLTRAEPILEKFEECEGLLADLRQLKASLRGTKT